MANLLRKQAYINGQWQATASSFQVNNPFNGELITKVADCGTAETKKAIQAAVTAFPAWKKLTAIDRSRILKRWHGLILEHKEALAQLLTKEQGKPIKEARGEIAYGASFVEWFAEEGKRVYGDIIPGHKSDKRITVLKEPVGVVAAITPWNFPNAMITRKVAPALAVGCPVIIKPAEDTPLSALALAVLAEEAGFPPGVFNVLPTSKPAVVGKVLTDAFEVRKLSFTGSTAVGKMLMQQCAASLKKLSMELGGNAPFIVFEDADIDAAVAGAISSKYRNAGQTCVCTNCFFIHASQLETFTNKFAAESQKLLVGEGSDEKTDIGPLINQKGLDKVKDLLDDALAKGARIVTGGQFSTASNRCMQPTVLADVSHEMKIAKEEIFGPIATIFSFETEDEAIALANDTRAGLAAYFYGTDYRRIWRVAEALEYGMVGINTGMISTAVAPFGGVKESGFGREGSKYGVEDYLTTKYLCWGMIDGGAI